MHVMTTAPINRAVTERWHEEYCKNPALHRHPQEGFSVCSTCGNYVQSKNTVVNEKEQLV